MLTLVHADPTEVYEEVDEDVPQDSFGISLTLAGILVSLPFYWVNFPGTKLSILNFAIALFVAVGFLRPIQLVRNLFEFWRTAKYFHILYLSYIFVCLISAVARPDFLAHAGNILRIPYFFLCYLFVGASLIHLSAARIRRTVLISACAGTLLFVGYAEYVFHSLGTNLLNEVRNSLGGRGSVSSVSFVRVIINYASGEVNLDRNAESLLGTARNAIAAILTFYSFVSLASLRRSNVGWTFSVAGAVATVVLSCSLLLLLMSRSNLLALLIGVSAASAIIFVSPYVSSKFKLSMLYLSILFIVASGSVFLVFRTDAIGDVISANQERFSKITDDPRAANYQSAFAEIRDNPWRGFGVASVTRDGYPVHNFLLAAWFESGIIGFFVAMLMYGELMRQWFRETLRRANLHFVGAMEMAFLPAIAASPIIRRMIAGDGGRFMLFELIPLAVFFVMVNMTNRMEEAESEEFYDDWDEDDDSEEEVVNMPMRRAA
jgi:O-antigen ligase